MYLKFHFNPPHIVYVINCILTHTFFFPWVYMYICKTQTKLKYCFLGRTVDNFTDLGPEVLYKKVYCKLGKTLLWSFKGLSLGQQLPKSSKPPRDNSVTAPHVAMK